MLAFHERNLLKNKRKSFHGGVVTKLFLSAISRGEDITIAKRYIVTAITLLYILALSQNALGMRRKVVDYKFITLGIKEPLLLLVVIALVTF